MRFIGMSIGVFALSASSSYAGEVAIGWEPYFDPAWTLIGYDPDELDTYRVTLIAEPGTWVNAVFGTQDHPMSLISSDGSFYDAPESGMTAPPVGCGIQGVCVQEPDTFVTIDYQTQDDNATGLTPDFGEETNWLASSFTTTNAAWFVADGDWPQGIVGPDGKLLIMQITVAEDVNVYGLMNVQLSGGQQFTGLEFFIPAPGALTLMSLGLLSARRRRR